MKIYIYLRNTEDWDQVGLDNVTFYHAQKHSNVPHWNKVSSLSWFEYRRKLKKICMKAIEGLDVPILYFGMDHSVNILDIISDDDFVLPTDDDDWFHPGIEHFVKQHSNCEVLLWDTVVNQTARRYAIHNFYEWHPHDVAGTNGYALRGSYLKRYFKKSGHVNSLMSHGEVLRHARFADADVKDLRKDYRMSCYNWHPGSMSAMNVIKDYMHVLKLFPCNEPYLPTHLDWLNPPYWKIIDLIQSLRS